MDTDSYKGWKNIISSVKGKHKTAFYHAKPMVLESMEYKTCQVGFFSLYYTHYPPFNNTTSFLGT